MGNNHRKIWSRHFGKIPKDEFERSYDIHHIDGNRKNNSISNLIAVSLKEHLRIHESQGDQAACFMIKIRMNEEIITDKWNHSEESKIKIGISSKKRGINFTEEHRKKLSLSGRGKILPERSEEYRKKMKRSKSGGFG